MTCSAIYLAQELADASAVAGPRSMACNFTRRRSRRVFRLIRNLPRRDLPQMKVKPRKLKVSGLPSPRRLRLFSASRPNSINRSLRMQR